MDLVLGGQFLGIGNDILELELLSRSLDKIFPKVVMCSMAYFGPSGGVVNNSGICTLPINIVNEKIYLVLWFWFLLLIMASLLCVTLQFILLFLPCTRYVLLQRKSPTSSSSHVSYLNLLSNKPNLHILTVVEYNQTV